MEAQANQQPAQDCCASGPETINLFVRTEHTVVRKVVENHELDPYHFIEALKADKPKELFLKAVYNNPNYEPGSRFTIMDYDEEGVLYCLTQKGIASSTYITYMQFYKMISEAGYRLTYNK